MLLALIEIISWFGGFKLGSIFLQRKNYSYRENFPILAIYYLIACLGLISQFQTELSIVVRNLSLASLAVVLLSITCYLLIGLIIGKRLPIPIAVQKQFPHTYIFKFDCKYMVTKITDVLFQQIFIWVILAQLIRDRLDESVTILIFSIIFISLHFFLVKLMGKIGWLYVTVSILPAPLFAYLILNYPEGYIYSFCLHLLGYLLLRVVIWKTI